MYGLKTEASFDSAHFLTDYYGKCENLHGHRWRAVVYLEVAVCDRLTEQGFPVSQVDLYETPNNCAIYRRTA